MQVVLIQISTSSLSITLQNHLLITNQQSTQLTFLILNLSTSHAQLTLPS